MYNFLYFNAASLDNLQSVDLEDDLIEIACNDNHNHSI